MHFGSILSPDAITLGLQAESKKQVLQAIANKAAEIFNLHERTTCEALSAREKLGSTGFGDGVALPHCRLETVETCQCVLITLAEPIDFDSDDDAPVDIILGLIAPSSDDADSLKCLAKSSRLLKEPALAEKLRGLTDPQAAYDLLTEGTGKKNAASPTKQVLATNELAAAA